MLLVERRVYGSNMLALFFVMTIIRLSVSELSCELPVVDEESIKYEFISEHTETSSGTNWTLNAFVSWDAPAQDGIGYDAFWVRFDTTQVPSNFKKRCDLNDFVSHSNEFHFTSNTNYTFEDVNFGFIYQISIFTANMSQERRTKTYSSRSTVTSLDCYNVTQDVDFCRDLPILAASSPANPRVSCLTPTLSNDMLFQSLFIQWNAPIQVRHNHTLATFYVDLYHVYEEWHRLLFDYRDVNETEKLAVQTTDLFPFSLNLKVLNDNYQPADLSRNETYVIKIYTNVENTRLWGNHISFTIDANDVPICVIWSAWSLWTPRDCCGNHSNHHRNRSRTCEDPYGTGLMCHGPGYEKNTCECSTPLDPRTPHHVPIALATCGIVILLASIMVLILWKWYCRSTDEDKENFILLEQETSGMAEQPILPSVPKCATQQSDDSTQS